MPGKLEINGLHRFHPGIPEDHSPYYASAAAVCLHRHHTSPKPVVVSLDTTSDSYEAEWSGPTAAEIRGLANKDEATRDAAYCIALAAAHAHLQRVALRRSEGLTGSDWYLVPADAEVGDDLDMDLERPDLVRLEVSGVDLDDDVKMLGRLNEKVRQARKGKSAFPAYAGVVGFRGARVQFAKVS
ncbi:MAG: hypothetical protein ACYC65_04010 [Candidatus Limnocylindrales bacterium]